eukprot:CAMPEP_0114245480 /NCGR_PEP_ID=MMETSP0058-20121206/11919_1 /TAXON_ID=36894 /ORGANISM="Pyramimonas parkeae, CCMP726" /LENGTH=662 /DNA_ID=CAMNT_0001358537 /DNA_START=323 /DNA_END=2308 /DNA_ORIENTATION=-
MAIQRNQSRKGRGACWVLAVPMFLMIPATVLHRLHWLHWEAASTHFLNISSDISCSSSIKSPCPLSTTCPACLPCNASTQSSPEIQALRVEDAASALSMDLGLNHDTDTPLVMLTFGNKAVWPMLSNWVANVQKLGLSSNMLVGALDEQLVKVCEKEGIPVEALDGLKAGMTNGAYLTKSQEDLKKYKLMASLKIGFALDLLKRQKQNVLISDSDTVWLRDPRAFTEEGPFMAADVLVSTDCIDTTADEICNAHFCGCAHVAFNTGIVFLRNTPATLRFVEAWKKKVLENDDLTIRDQAAFNIVLREGFEPKTVVPGFESYPRQTLMAWRGQIKLGILPLLFFQNGHTYFSQKLHERRNIVPYVVHATYQYGDGAVFPFGKRQRMREAGLWLMDGPEYSSGNFLAVSWAGATRPEFRVPLDTDSRIIVKHHFEEDKFRRKTVRNALAIAALLNRTLIMPRILCYVDQMWKEMRAGRFAGAYGMALPFDCPMDYLFELPRFFEEAGRTKTRLDFREPGFLNRLPKHLASSRRYIHVVPRDKFLNPFDNKFLPEITRNGQQIPTTQVHEGMMANEVVSMLDRFKDVRVLELSKAVSAFCGWEDNTMNQNFDDLVREPMRKKWEFKYMETGQEGIPNYKYWVPYDQFEWMNGFEDMKDLVDSPNW